MITFAEFRCSQPVTVTHQGKIIALAIARHDDPRNKAYSSEEENLEKNIYQHDLVYRVLSLNPDIPQDDDNWSSVRKLSFPDEMRPIGYNLIQVGSHQAKADMHTPFQLVSDGKHVCLFRQSTRGSLLLTRFLLIDDVNDETGEIVPVLQSPWEVRYQRSRKANVPSGLKDSRGFKDMNDEAFLEPTFELCFISDLSQGRFSVLILPTSTPNMERWQIFAHNDSTGNMDAYSIPRSEDGLFILEADEGARLKMEVSSFSLENSSGQYLNFTTAPDSILYQQQEYEQDINGTDQLLKRGARVMMAVGAGEMNINLPTGEYLSGSLEMDGYNDVVRAGYMKTWERSDGYSFQVYENYKVSTLSSLTVSVWVKPINLYDTARQEIVDIYDSNGHRIHLRFWEGQIRWGIYENNGAGYQYTKWTIPNSRKAEWMHITGVYEKDTDGALANLILYLNGEEIGRKDMTSKSIDDLTEGYLVLGAQQGDINDPANLRRFYNGYLGEFGFWTKALSPAEIQNVFGSGIPATENSAFPTNPSFYWLLNESSGNTSIDQTYEPDQDPEEAISGYFYGNPLWSDQTPNKHLPKNENPVAILDFGLNKDGTLANVSSDALALQSVSMTNGKVEFEGTNQVIYEDEDGLTLKAHHLEFARTIDKPKLLNSADGLLHLYFNGEEGTFSVAEFQTQIERASYLLALESETTTDGNVSLEFKSRKQLKSANSASLMVSEYESNPGICLLQATMGDLSENWFNLPRGASQVEEILNGLATDLAEDDGLIREGKKTFFAYRSNRALVQLRQGTGSIWFINRHDQEITSETAENLKAILSIQDDDHCSLELGRTLIEQGVSVQYKEIWRSLPRNPEELVRILNGMDKAGSYDYQSNAQIFEIDGRNQKLLEEKSAALAGGSYLFTLVDHEAESIEEATAQVNPRAWVTSSNTTEVDFTNGSRLFAVQPKDLPDDGSSWALPDQTINTPNKTGNIGTWSPPEPNYSLYFDGNTEVELDPARVKEIEQDFTFETWIKPDDVIDNTNSSLIQVKQAGAKPILFGIYSETDGKHYPIAAKDTFGVKSKGTSLIPNDWNHLAASYKFGYALEFDGNHYVDCGDDSQFNPYNSLTLEAWVHWDGSNGRKVILSKRGDDAGYELALEDGKIDFTVFVDYKDYFSGEKVSGEGHTIQGDTLASVDGSGKAIWYFITVKASIRGDTQEEELLLEIDYQNLTDRTEDYYRLDYWPNLSVSNSIYTGFAPSTVATDLKFVDSNTPLIIGGTQGEDEDEPTGSFKGMIDEVRIWTRHLENNETEENVDNFGITENLEGLISRWELKVGEGDTAYDSVGTNHGTISDPDLWTNSDISTVWQLYLNGNLVEDAEPLEGGETHSGPSEQLSIGATLGSGYFDNHFKGEIDEVRIWNYIRTLEQINDNRYRPLTGSEEGLEGYWKMNDASEPEQVRDHSGNNNTGLLSSGDAGYTPANSWVLSDSPIASDAPEVFNVLASSSSGIEKQLLYSPQSEEYGDLQYDSKGQLIGVLKRCYIYHDIENGELQLLSGFKVGDLDIQFIRQVQTAPTLTGFIEGAPPVPSENLTVESAGYENTASIELQEARETVHMYSSSREDGSHQSFEYAAGGMVSATLNLSFGAFGASLSTQAAYLKGKLGKQSLVQHSNGSLDSASFTDGTSRSIRNRLSLSGMWEKPNEEGEYLNPQIGKRYIPKNVGYALVKSRTADLYALRLKAKGTLVAYQLALNPDIPEDWNIIMFPLNNKYVKNGTLDGRIGYTNDPDYQEAGLESGSYFKPLEAYSLKNQIQNQEQNLKSYYERFYTKARRDDNPPDELAGWENKAAKRSLVNTYVWTADGGLYAEEEQFMVQKKESIGGTFQSKQGSGRTGSIEGTIVGIGGFAEFDALRGSYINITSMKTQEESQSFGMKLELDGEGFLNQYNEDSQQYEAELTPGKVDAYRFMTFYLSPKKDHFDEFFDKVVDDNWLQTSDDANARALRSAKAAENGVWRVMHRVTYVSRVPQAFQSASEEAGEPQQSQLTVLDEEANMELLDLVEEKLVAEPIETPSLTDLAETIDHLLAPTGNGSPSLEDKLAWWPAYWNDLSEEDQQGIRQDMITYLKGYYELE